MHLSASGLIIIVPVVMTKRARETEETRLLLTTHVIGTDLVTQLVSRAAEIRSVKIFAYQAFLRASD